MKKLLLPLLLAVSLQVHAQDVGVVGKWPHASRSCPTADATYGLGQQFDPFPNATQALDSAITWALTHKGSDNVATLRVRPGTYTLSFADTPSWAVNADLSNLTLCGDGGIAHFKLDANSFRYTVQELATVRIINMDWDGAFPGLYTARDGIEILNSRIANTATECVTWGDTGTVPGDKDPTDTKSYWYFRDSKFEGCGFNDGDGHAWYMSRRGCSGYAINNEMDSQTTLEAFRSLCRFNVFQQNTMSNMGRDPVRPGQSGVLDIPACGLTLIRNNKVTVEGDNPFFNARGRRSITGCDMPNQTEYLNTGVSGIPPYLVRDLTFWNSVRALPFPLTNSDPSALLTNPQLFPVLLQNNEVVALDDPKSPGYNFYTTFAQDKVASLSEYLRMPPNWTERSFVINVGLWPTGFDRAYVVTRPGMHPDTLDDVELYVETVLDVTEKVKVFTVSTPPQGWVPQSNNPKFLCTFFRARYHWLDEVNGGEGFPKCDIVPNEPDTTLALPRPPSNLEIL